MAAPDDNDRNSGKKKLTPSEKDDDDAPNLEKKLSEKDGDNPVS